MSGMLPTTNCCKPYTSKSICFIAGSVRTLFLRQTSLALSLSINLAILVSLPCSHTLSLQDIVHMLRFVKSHGVPLGKLIIIIIYVVVIINISPSALTKIFIYLSLSFSPLSSLNNERRFGKQNAQHPKT